ncbi:MAG: CUAEP/CCAEP-tail radical SAM (seleno)protein [Acidimicrobiia bacterium]
MAVLLVSTYELGHQPIHLASPAAALKAAGVETVCLDLSVDDFDPSLLDTVEAVAFSVPMHTAMRLAVAAATRVRELRPDLLIAFYGLYADVGKERNLGTITDVIFCGEYEPGLVDWATRSGPVEQPVKVNLGKAEFQIPDRSGLAGLDRYARLEHDGRARLAAAVEASHGCRHRCRHCPIPAVYDGRMRVVGQETVLGDIDQLVLMGAEHITFSDPDFLNAPAYSMGILRAAHAAHPDLSFDVTVKVEHILNHRELWPEMADLGVLFVVSAFESVDDTTLRILDKGHTVADMSEAVAVMREAGVHLRPTWLPFLPWTTTDDIAEIFRFLASERLSASVDPVQMAIKLLIPEGSLLVDRPEVKSHLTHFDPEALTWRWNFESSEAELLQKELDRIAAAASDCQQDTHTTLLAMWEMVSSVTGQDLGRLVRSEVQVPRLSESWFCCAEPTVGQASAIGPIVMRRRPE